MTDTAIDLPQLLTDAPATEDLLGFKPHAERLAALIQKQIPDKASFVIGIEGEWGEGKSSFINLLKDAFPAEKTDETRPTIVDFNPWWFEGSDQLLRHFFDELLGQIDRSGRWTASARKFMHGLASLLDGGGKAVQLLPAPGVMEAGKAAEKAGELLRVLGTEKTKSAQVLKASSAHVLADLSFKTIVFIDDLDRLPAREIVELFRVIKAVADLPNIVYIIAYDRAIVASALDEVHKARGEAYLEKIVQLPYRLPKPTKDKLERYNKNALLGSGAVSSVVPDQFDAEVSFRYISQAFLKLPRDVKRLQASMCTFGLVPEAIRMDPLDFMFLEALRLKQRVLWLALTNAVLDADGYVTVAEGATDREAARLDWLRAKMPTLEKTEDPITDAVRFFTGWTLTGDGQECRAQTTQRLSWLSKPLQNITDAYTWLDEIAVLQSMVHAYLQLQQDEGQYSNQQIEKFLLATSSREYEAALPSPPHGRFLYEAAGYLEHQTPEGFVLEHHLTAMAASLEQEFQRKGHVWPAPLIRLLMRYFCVVRANSRDLSSKGLELFVSWLSGEAPMLVTLLAFSREPSFQALKTDVVRHYLEGELGELLALPNPQLATDVLFALAEGDEDLLAAWAARLPIALPETDMQRLSALFSLPSGQEKLAHSWLTSCQPFVDLVRQLPRLESSPAPWDAFLQKAIV